MNLNKAILVGRITKDPEQKALPNGQAVVNFGLATNRFYKDKEGNRQESAEFHNLVAFGKQADTIATYCKKGQELLVEGRIQTRSWEAEGKKNYRTEIVVETFQFGSKEAKTDTSTKPLETEPQVKRQVAEGVDYPEDEIDVDSIPF